MGSGGGGSSSSSPVLFSWKELLPPWVQTGQRAALPMLMSRAAEGGLLPTEERALWSGALENIATGAEGAQSNLARQLAMSGIRASSPAAAGALGELASDRLRATQQAASDLVKTKIGARDTAIGQLLTALYTPPPAAVGQVSHQSQSGGK